MISFVEVGVADGIAVMSNHIISFSTFLLKRSMNRCRMAKPSFCSRFLSSPNRNVSIWDSSCFHKAIMIYKMSLTGLGHPICRAFT